MKTILFLVANVLLVSAGPTVQIAPGTVEGFDFVTSSGSTSEIFLGVPFAQPPVGDLRFEKPAEILQFTDGYVNASAFGFSCHPHAKAAMPHPTSEDCLFMNIIKPKVVTEPLPVLVWIHGGGFEFGSTHNFGYKGFANVYNPKGVIVISIQYRVGIYGFLSTGNNIIPGNLGLWDMTESLKFINKYISAFGGDPNQVTVWGLSAGGCAAGQLAISPFSRNFLQRTIQMSGSPFSSWGYGPTVPVGSWDVIERVGCKDVADVKACMKDASVEEIYDATAQSGWSTADLNTVKWGPVIDGEFMTDTADVMAKNITQKKPAYLGLGNKDGGFFTLMGMNPYLHQMELTNAQFQSFSRQDLVNTIRRLIAKKFFPLNHEKVVKKLVDFYVDQGANNSVGSGFYVDRYSLFLNDIFFTVPAVRESDFRSKNNFPTYVYSMDHYNGAIWKGRTVPDEAKGSVHTNEYPYMFEFFQLGLFDLFSDEERPVTESIRDSIINFTKTGVPSITHTNFKQYGGSKQYLSINPKPVVRNNFYKNAAKLWDDISKMGFDIVTMIQLRQQY
ncbi:unnamed protein product [Auanema sp. JU1783]|nr:unnamed protein product [Auanema sp. JU1783]